MRCSIKCRSSGASSRKSGMIFSSASEYRMAPWTFFEPGDSPRSSCSTLRPALAAVYAAAFPEGPPPTTITSNRSLIHFPFASTREFCRGQMLTEGFGQRGQDLHRVADDGVRCKIEDRRILILVDGDDDVGRLHPHAVLNRTGDAGSDIELRPHGLTRLAHLPIGAHPTGLHHRPCGAHFRAQHLGKIPHQLKVLRTLQTPAARDYDVGIGELCLVPSVVGD